jgi:ligand-binding sensor domain-containing protein
MQQVFLYSCLFFLSALLPFSTHAQLPGFKEYSFEDKNTKIFSLLKDDKGYILAGTSTGLFRFDGITFHKIETNKQGRTDSVTAVFQDSNRDIWIGCYNGSIAKTANGKWQQAEPEEGLPEKKITAFVQDKEGNIWFGTAGEGIYHFYNSKLYLVNEENGLSDLNIHSLTVTGNGDILAATDQGLNICTVKGNRVTVKIIGPAQGLPDYIVTSVFQQDKDNYWVGLQDKGFCLYNYSTQKITVPAESAHWDKGQVNDLHFAHDKLWIATQDSGLLCYSAFTRYFMPCTSSGKKAVNNIIEDNQGNNWFITDNSLLARTSGNTVQLYPFYNENFFPTVHTVLVDKNNNYWTGTDMAIVKFTNATPVVSKKYVIPGLDAKTDITSLYQDKFDKIWIGTMGKGIFLLDAVTGKTRLLKEALRNSSILSLTGTGNTVCAAGLEGAMVFELTEENAGIDNPCHFTYFNKIESIGSNYIYSVFKDSKGRLWFATDGKGLTVLQNGVYTHYDKSSGIKDEHIYSVTEDKAGRIWFSTSKAGVYSFDGKIFSNYATKEGLSSLLISAVKTDRLGNIVVVHKDGLDIIDAKTGHVSYINAVQDVEEINDDLGAVCTDAMGNVFVATKKGIVRYEALAGISNIPKTVIENVQLFLDDIDTARVHYFAYDENNITFNFAGLYFTNPEKVFYEYKLEGLFAAWQFTTDNSRTFPRLAPGKYVFKVRSSLSKNFAYASEASFAFEVAKPFWRTWWFVAGVILLITGLLYWYIKRRERQLTHVQELKNEKVKFEFEVLRNQVNPHFLFNSFNTLISTIEDDPKAGVEYVEKLSDFFRNMVNYRDSDTISLKEEISLLQNYLYLQQKRYGTNLRLGIEVSEKEQPSIFLPPLTLQLLMENAIKHNAVSKEAILLITVALKEEYLVVQNNINKKISKEKGTGMGLQNIKSRYALLHPKPVEIHDDGNNFIVKLPILKK